MSNMRRLKQSLLAGALVGAGFWALAVLNLEGFPKDDYFFLPVSFLFCLLITAALSLIFFYAIPMFIVRPILQYIAAKADSSRQGYVKDHYTSTKVRYRFSTGLIFAFAATIAMPVFYTVMAFVLERGPSSEKILGSVSFSAIFSIAAFFWGVLLASRFQALEDETPLFFIIISFLWGCAITGFTMFSTGFFLGVIQSIKDMELSMKPILYSLLILGMGSVITNGILYLVGGAAGVIAGLRYRRITG